MFCCRRNWWQFFISYEIPKELPMKQKALCAGDAHSHEDEECRKRSTLCFGRCLTSATGAQQRARRENVPRRILSYCAET